MMCFSSASLELVPDLNDLLVSDARTLDLVGASAHDDLRFTIHGVVPPSVVGTRDFSQWHATGIILKFHLDNLIRPPRSHLHCFMQAVAVAVGLNPSSDKVSALPLSGRH